MGQREVAQVETWQPPWWLLVFGPLCWLLVASLVLRERGWVLALVTLVLLAPIGMPLPPLMRWVRRHRRLDGAYAGPPVFAAAILLTELPLWLCTATALTALLLGLLLTTIRDLAHE